MNETLPVPVITPDETSDFEASENGPWVSVEDIGARRAFWREVARRSLSAKRTRISLSIPDRDLLRLKAKAAERGITYDVLISSILHEFAES